MAGVPRQIDMENVGARARAEQESSTGAPCVSMSRRREPSFVSQSQTGLVILIPFAASAMARGLWLFA